MELKSYVAQHLGKKARRKVKQNNDFPSSQCISTLSSVKRQKLTFPAPPTTQPSRECTRGKPFFSWFAGETGGWAGRVLQRPQTPQKLVLSHRGIVGNGRRCPSFWVRSWRRQTFSLSLALVWKWNGACPWFGAEVFGLVSSDPWNGGNNAGRGLEGVKSHAHRHGWRILRKQRGRTLPQTAARVPMKRWRLAARRFTAKT